MENQRQRGKREREREGERKRKRKRQRLKRTSAVELIIDRHDWFNEYHRSRLIIVTLVIPLSSLDSIGRAKRAPLPVADCRFAGCADQLHRPRLANKERHSTRDGILRKRASTQFLTIRRENVDDSNPSREKGKNQLRE